MIFSIRGYFSSHKNWLWEEFKLLDQQDFWQIDIKYSRKYSSVFPGVTVSNQFLNVENHTKKNKRDHCALLQLYCRRHCFNDSKDSYNLPIGFRWNWQLSSNFLRRTFTVSMIHIVAENEVAYIFEPSASLRNRDHSEVEWLLLENFRSSNLWDKIIFP